MTEPQAYLVTRALVIGTPLAWICWDTFVMFAFGRKITISYCFWDAYLAWRFFPLALGLVGVGLYWHFFLQ